MRPSQRRAKREREAMLKNVGIGAGVLAAAGSIAGAVVAYDKKKKASKTEDKLEDIKSAD